MPFVPSSVLAPNSDGLQDMPPYLEQAERHNPFVRRCERRLRRGLYQAQGSETGGNMHLLASCYY